MICEAGCMVLKYRGESFLQDRIIGQCLECGCIRHGYRCNWRVELSPVRGFIVMIRRAEPKTAKSKSSSAFDRAHQQVVAPTIDMNALAGLQSVSEMIAKLKKMGVNIK